MISTIQKLGPAARVTLGLLSLAVTLLLIFDLVLGVFPNPEKQELQRRQKLAENTTVQIATLISNEGQRFTQPLMNDLVRREDQLRSIGIRNADGQLLAATQGHADTWGQIVTHELGRSQFVVPIHTGGGRQQRWGQVEFAFEPMSISLIGLTIFSPVARMVLLFSLVAGGLYYLYLRRTFQHLDPSSAVPERVQMAFDAMSEAVLVLDGKGRIVMYNSGFEALLPEVGEPIVGRDPATFKWLTKGFEHASDTPPWVECVQKAEPIKGINYEVSKHGNTLKLTVNCSPVLDAKNTVRGCMVSFSDVTELEESRSQLVGLMTELAASKEQLEVQNLELQRLASVDPMTGALNRRSFFPIFERMFREASEGAMPLSFVMCDIDKFKTINDIYGHQAGDKVIQKFGGILLRSARDNDVVCRYGGEEFCIALPATNPVQAEVFAQRLRERVEAEVKDCIELTDRKAITVSIGIASVGMGAVTPTELADQADQALYVAKNSGRNRCVIYSSSMSSAAAQAETSTTA